MLAEWVIHYEDSHIKFYDDFLDIGTEHCGSC